MSIASNISMVFFLIATLLQHLRESTCTIVEFLKEKSAELQPNLAIEFAIS